jgi:hypothetical protein
MRGCGLWQLLHRDTPTAQLGHVLASEFQVVTVCPWPLRELVDLKLWNLLQLHDLDSLIVSPC